MDFTLLQSIIAILIVFLSIAFHEYSHGWMANELGDPTAERAGRLTLNPIKHIDLIGSIILPLFLVLSQSPFLFGWAKPVPYNEANLRNPRRDGALVAFAGPGSNLLLALIGAIFFRLFRQTGLMNGFSIEQAGAIMLFFTFVIVVNVGLAIFNLIPVPPLDGSKILSAFLPDIGRRLFFAMERLGPILIFVILIFAFSAIAPFLGRVIGDIFRFLTGVSLF